MSLNSRSPPLNAAIFSAPQRRRLAAHHFIILRLMVAAISFADAPWPLDHYSTSLQQLSIIGSPKIYRSRVFRGFSGFTRAVAFIFRAAILMLPLPGDD